VLQPSGDTRFSLMNRWFYNMIASADRHKFKKERKCGLSSFLPPLNSLVRGLWAWHSQGAGKLTQAEIDQYLAMIEKLPLPEKGVQAFTTRLRPWAEADDGKPVYMFNSSTSFPCAAISRRAGVQGNTRTGQRTL